MDRVRSLYYSAIAERAEQDRIVQFLRDAGARTEWRILDIGCGFGRNLQALRDAGLQPTGVDVNPETVVSVRERGFPCFEPGDAAIDQEPWDAFVLSHVIEHFAPADLLEFLNGYLARLKPGGYVVLATPLLHRGFYEDFDHVKPYTPHGISQFFGAGSRQIQAHGEAELELIDLWFRRQPLLIRYRRSIVLSRMTAAKGALGVANVALAGLYALTLRRLGKTTGWVGLYRKTR